MHIITMNYKGGCGKSTNTMQIAAPYIFEKTKSIVEYFEYDTHNKDSLSFEKSEIVHINQPCTDNDTLSMYIPDFISKKNAVMDVGAGQDLDNVIKMLNGMDFWDDIDLVIIPITDGEMDAIEGSHTFRDLPKDVKVVFALTKSKTNSEGNALKFEFLKFFGDEVGWTGNTKLGGVNNALKKHLNYFGYYVLPYEPCVNNSRYFKQTIYELALTPDEKFKNTFPDDKTKQALRTLFYNNCRLYKLHYLDNKIFAKIDEILNG